MNVSETERKLRIEAAQSALASVRIAGLQPSEKVEALFGAWAEGNVSLDNIRDAFKEELRAEHDRAI